MNGIFYEPLKRTLLLLIITVLPLIASEHKSADLKPPVRKKQPLLEGTTLRQELTEGALMSAILAADLWFKTLHPFFDEPLLPSPKVDEDEDPTVESLDLVPIIWIHVGAITPNLLLLMLPNNQGFLNSVSYRHAKGFAEASFIVTPFFTDLAKLTFGKKRPNYPALTKDGTEPVNARKSFWSLHAATSFSVATYSSLWLFRHFDGTGTDNLFWKIPVSGILYTMATMISISRDYNLDHDDIDLVVGGCFGSLMAASIFAIHEGWLLNLYKPSPKSGFYLTPAGLKYTFSF